ncbi:MAG: glycosyltransferase [Limimaricola soesokkakensis]|uniref:glycosyltransferase n=1 Tax=Limimaricola soesokkakensis TaxID=1343159 RepID=UPI00405943C8
MAKIVYVCNTAGIAARFRRPVLKAALSEGYEVSVICGEGVNAPSHVEELRAIGATVYRLPGLENDGMSGTQLRRQALEVGRILDKIRPDILHSFTHRANIASYFALRRRPGIRFIPNVTGAGRLFGDGASLRDKVARHALLSIYRAMAPRVEVIFFQNSTDLAEIGGYMRVSPRKMRLTGGSGFDPSEITERGPIEVAEIRHKLAATHGIDPDKRLFLFPSRALKSKGVAEFYEASERYLDLFDDAVFVHAGEASSAPQGLDESELNGLQRRGLYYLGFRNDILELMESASAVVLPSSYREGIPRSLIEALYFGKSILTTDSPGCRETVIDGWNGKLFRPGSTQALLSAFVSLRNIDPLIASENSRKLFDSRFHSERVVRVYIEQYKAPARTHGDQR